MPKILAIDDNPDNLTSLRAILKDTFPEAAVLTALNGPKGIALARNENPDVILLDIVMPDMDGFAVCRKLKSAESTQGIPVIFLTATKTDRQNRIKALEVGAEGFLGKPLDETELLFQIRSMVKIKAANDLKRDESKRLAALVAERTMELQKELAERKHAEEALQKSEEKYRLIAKNMSDVISVLDMNLKFTYVSPSIKRLTGFTVEEAIQHSIEEIVTPESLKTIMDVFEEEMMLETSGTADPGRTRIIEIEQSKKDISIVWVEVACSFIRDAERKPAAILLISRDITKRKLAEAELERMMAAIEQAGETIVIADTDGMMQYVNPAFEKVTGYTRAEAAGQNPRLLKSGHQDEIFYRQLWETISSGKTWSGRMVNRKKDGSFYTEDATISPVFDATGRIINYVAVKRDITEHLLLTNQLQQTQKMEAIGTLAGGIAHDFNNILSAILGYTELSMPDFPQGSDTRENLEAVYKAGNRAKDLVQQILAFSRQTEHQFFETHIHLIIKEALKLLRSTLPTTIEIKQNIRALGRVLADPTQIHQVMMNLCVNAFHAMSENGGELMVSLLRVNAPEDISVPNHLLPGPYLKLTARDTGCGIPPEVRNRIFDPYFTTKGMDKGTGLGLSVVHGIVQSHGGCVDVESALGKGSSFHVYLPEVVTPVKDSETIKKEKAIVTGTGRILVVDDEPPVAGMLKKTLEKLGYEVTKRTSSVEALELFKAKPEQFDLVITDMTMPHMTGYGLSRQLIKIRPDIPIVLCSGFHEKISAETNKAIGIREVVMKPVLQHVLSQTIRKVLDQSKLKATVG